MLLLTASNENLKRIVELLSAESVYHLFNYVREHSVLTQTRKRLNNFDFVYQYFEAHNLIVITAFKSKYAADFNYGISTQEIYEINKICNEFLDADQYI